MKGDWVMPRIFLITIITIALTAPLSARKITFDDLYSVPSCNDPQISPDGRRIVFDLHTSDPTANSEEDHLWIINSDGTGARQLTYGSSGEWNPRWSPDGKAIFFISDREESPQVWLLPLDGGEAHRVTSIPTSVSDITILSDNRKLLLISRIFPQCESDSCNKALLDKNDKSSDKPMLFDKLLFRHYNRWDDGRIKRMFIAVIGDSSVTEVYASRFDMPTALLGGYHDYDISPDGEIAFAMSTDSIPAVRVDNNIYLIKPGGEPFQLTDAPGLETTPRYSPDGRLISYLSAARAGYESDQRDLIIYDRQKKSHINLTKNFDRSIDEYTWDPKSRFIYFTAAEYGFIKVWRIDTGSGKIERLLGDAVYGDLRLSPDGRFLILNRSLSNQPYELYRYDIGSRKLSRLTYFTKPVITGIDMRPAEEFWFTGSFGDSIHGFLTLPPDFDAAKMYPLAFLIHGGPQWSWIGDFNYYGWNTQLMAAQGYVVAQTDPHGSAGFGQKFQDYVSGNWGKGDYDDLMMGIDFLLAQYPFIDSTRMAALGRSYGGFMTNWICGHTDRFRCLITTDGTYNHVAEYGSTDELWFPEWEYNGTPWTNREEYVRSSPSTYAENFKTPTLIIHGQRDYRVDLSEGLQMFTTLQRLGVPSELYYFPNSGHGIDNLENLRAVYDRQLEWLARWLGN
jgi:dipeptidyl aminopeptidase/acylaminoacyl peptidase